MLKKFSLITTSLLITSISINRVEALTFVSSRAALNANDKVDWSSKFISPPFSVVGYNFTATSVGNFGINISIPFLSPSTGITPPFVFKTGAMVPTNFANGDYVLFTGFKPGSGVPALGNPGPISIAFSHPVAAAGTQIATDDALVSYSATIDAYDSNNLLLGSFSVPTTSSTALDNSAVFLGVSSDVANIASIKIYSNLTSQAIGINTLSIETVPESSTSLASILIVLASFATKKRSKDGL